MNGSTIVTSCSPYSIVFALTAQYASLTLNISGTLTVGQVKSVPVLHNTITALGFCNRTQFYASINRTAFHHTFT